MGSCYSTGCETPAHGAQTVGSVPPAAGRYARGHAIEFGVARLRRARTFAHDIRAARKLREPQALMANETLKRVVVKGFIQGEVVQRLMANEPLKRDGSPGLPYPCRGCTEADGD